MGNEAGAEGLVVRLFDAVEVRACKRCGELKPVGEFPGRSLGNGRWGRHSYCVPCRRAYQRDWYVRNRDRRLAARAARRETERPSRPPERTPRPLREAVGFQKLTNPRKQGNSGLGIAIAYFCRVGAEVAIPLTDTQPYDLIIDRGDGLERVQVKTTTMREGNSYVVHLRTVGGNKSQVKVRTFDPSDYEWLFVVCGDATAYLIPSSAISSRYSLFLGRRCERFRLEDESG